jgi:rsbT antagonist protein RsbS
MTSEKIAVVRVKDTLMVTVPAEPDDATISDLQEQILTAMQRYDAHGLIIDISTVDTLDSYFARTITETGQMVSLMGGETIIVGMRPSVAITAVQLGLTLGHVRTALDVGRAFDVLHAPDEHSGDAWSD